ncbi:uncharacterized protein BKCO1_890001 [Diplodia corticola]|uniref:Uncharacterized protein n=1 Tax=Diplodia corticola TaxID=236234 RepID=A0A1J9RNK5_9PEZI|nr:uncharacterized protein BKCO1_890001 [Diplodia corticola]OJD29173.1 hypothetical protein BKCO1_890001 [Diplodia corticola]
MPPPENDGNDGYDADTEQKKPATTDKRSTDREDSPSYIPPLHEQSAEERALRAEIKMVKEEIAWHKELNKSRAAREDQSEGGNTEGVEGSKGTEEVEGLD